MTIQSKSESQDATGDPVESWSTLAAVWAEDVPLSASEHFAAHSFESRVSRRLRVRYRTDVTALMRVNIGSRYYDIEGVVDPDGKKRSLELYCRERVN